MKPSRLGSKGRSRLLLLFYGQVGPPTTNLQHNGEHLDSKIPNMASSTPDLAQKYQLTIENLPSDMSSFMQQFYHKNGKQIRELLVKCQLKQLEGSLPVKP